MSDLKSALTDAGIASRRQTLHLPRHEGRGDDDLPLPPPPTPPSPAPPPPGVLAFRRLAVPDSDIIAGRELQNREGKKRHGC
jgi:hypothetical protein